MSRKVLHAVAAVSLVTYVTQREIGLGGQLGMDVRVLNAFQSYLWYIGKTLWPSGLAACGRQRLW